MSARTSRSPTSPTTPTPRRSSRQFDAALDALRSHGHDCGLVHAANSAAALACADARYDLVRIGIAAYGLPPARAFADVAPLRPALSLHARVMMVRELAAGERLSYGLQATSCRVQRPGGHRVGWVRRRRAAQPRACGR